jgi:radical SAM protein with 4Fe4S-binding SPASM domain
MVTPCCALPRHIVGDLKKETLTQIWNGKNMKEFRKHHKQICRDCHVFKIR